MAFTIDLHSITLSVDPDTMALQIQCGLALVSAMEVEIINLPSICSRAIRMLSNFCAF